MNRDTSEINKRIKEIIENSHRSKTVNIDFELSAPAGLVTKLMEKLKCSEDEACSKIKQLVDMTHEVLTQYEIAAFGHYNPIKFTKLQPSDILSEDGTIIAKIVITSPDKAELTSLAKFDETGIAFYFEPDTLTKNKLKAGKITEATLRKDYQQEPTLKQNAQQTTTTVEPYFAHGSQSILAIMGCCVLLAALFIINALSPNVNEEDSTYRPGL